MACGCTVLLLPNIAGTLNLNAGSVVSNEDPRGLFATDAFVALDWYGPHRTLQQSSEAVTTKTWYGLNSNFNASRSSPIYGNSNTVQPQAIKGYLYMVLANKPKTPIQVNLDNIAADLALKANANLSNVDNTGSATMAHASMPSGQYIDLPIPLTPNVYYTTVPSDGFVIARGTATGSADGAIFELATKEYSTTHVCIPYKGWGISASLAVQKGASIKINYVNATVNFVRFFYANGTAPQS